MDNLKEILEDPKSLIDKLRQSRLEYFQVLSIALLNDHDVIVQFKKDLEKLENDAKTKCMKKDLLRLREEEKEKEQQERDSEFSKKQMTKVDKILEDGEEDLDFLSAEIDKVLDDVNELHDDLEAKDDIHQIEKTDIGLAIKTHSCLSNSHCGNIAKCNDLNLSLKASLAMTLHFVQNGGFYAPKQEARHLFKSSDSQVIGFNRKDKDYLPDPAGHFKIAGVRAAKLNAWINLQSTIPLSFFLVDPFSRETVDLFSLDCDNVRRDQSKVFKCFEEERITYSYRFNFKRSKASGEIGQRKSRFILVIVSDHFPDPIYLDLHVGANMAKNRNHKRYFSIDERWTKYSDNPEVSLKPTFPFSDFQTMFEQ